MTRKSCHLDPLYQEVMGLGIRTKEGEAMKT